MSGWVIYDQVIKAIDEFRNTHFHTHVQVKVSSYLFILLNDAIWMIILKLMHSICQKRVISEHKRLIK